MDDYNMLQSLAIGCGWFIVKNNKFANPLLEIGQPQSHWL